MRMSAKPESALEPSRVWPKAHLPFAEWCRSHTSGPRFASAWSGKATASTNGYARDRPAVRDEEAVPESPVASRHLWVSQFGAQLGCFVAPVARGGRHRYPFCVSAKTWPRDALGDGVSPAT